MSRRPPFVMVPAALIYDEHVSGDACRLWALLDDLARDAPAAPAFVAQLAAVMHCSERTIQRLRGELEATGWLAVHGVVGGRGTPPLWQPLNRPRPVDNPVETASDLTGLSSVKGDRSVGVSRASLPIRARDEEKNPRPSPIIAAQTAAACRPRCGRCDETRHVTTIDPVTGADVVTRCPVCHSLRDRF